MVGGINTENKAFLCAKGFLGLFCSVQFLQYDQN